MRRINRRTCPSCGRGLGYMGTDLVGNQVWICGPCTEAVCRSNRDRDTTESQSWHVDPAGIDTTGAQRMIDGRQEP